MSKFTKKPPPAADPAEAVNARIREDIRQRNEAIENQKALANDIGLNMKPAEPTGETAAEFLSDAWDRKTFGDSIPTYTRVIYGPDPLLISCPDMKLTIEKIGLEEYAQTTAETILLREENAVRDSVMQKGLRLAIARFGVESVALAFKQRILKIPTRTVEVEADRSDAMIFAQPMEEAVQRYGTPGMAPKFLSERCISVLGTRGYVIVKDEKGDPVKVGTLIMGEIPQHMADARKRHYAEMSNEQLRTMAEEFEDTAQRRIREDGGARGISVLGTGDRVTANAAGDIENDPELTSSYLGRSRETGFTAERQR